MKDLEEYLSQETNFEIMQLLNHAILKVFTSSISTILRFCHIREIIAAAKYHNGMTVEYIAALSNEIKLDRDFLMDIVYKTLATKYYGALETMSFFRYGFTILKTHQFKAVVNTIRFLESNEIELDDKSQISRAKRDQIKRHFSTDYSLINVSNE